MLYCTPMNLKRGPRVRCCDTGAGEPERVYPDLEQAARLFHAIADETRLAILRQLRERGEVNACDFVGCCAVAQPTVSHHLKVLRRAGLVAAERRGVCIYYRLNEQRIEELRQLLP
jgi:ArsR family transcriptional regulator